MIQDIRVRKLRKRFALLDLDDSGFIERRDYAAIADRTCRAFDLDGGAGVGKRLTESYLRLFDGMHRKADSDGDGRIDCAEFIETIFRSLIERSDGFVRVMVPVIDTLMSACDADGDERLSEAEFRSLLQVYGLTDDDVAVAFGKLDRNCDGGLSHAEFVQATREFYCSDDPDAPGNWFFGSF